MEIGIFSILTAFILVPAVMVVTIRNVFHSALWLIVSMLGVGGFYAMLAADFLFAVQLLVYAGGVMVVMLFVILLSGKPSDWAQRQVNDKAWAALIFSAIIMTGLVTVLDGWGMVSQATEATVTTARLGELLLNEMLIPLEVISIVLVAALVGAVYFSARRSS